MYLTSILESNQVLLDVRTPEEFAEGIYNAISINLNQISSKKSSIRSTKTKPIILLQNWKENTEAVKN